LLLALSQVARTDEATPGLTTDNAVNADLNGDGASNASLSFNEVQRKYEKNPDDDARAQVLHIRWHKSCNS